MATIYIYTYRCTNGQCRYIELQNGVKKMQIPCPKCGHQMNLIKTEKMET
jgi:hypothetical protein